MYSGTVENGAYESGKVLRNWDRQFRLETVVVLDMICVCCLHVNDDFFKGVSKVCICVTGGVPVNDFCCKLTNVTILAKSSTSFLGCMSG